MSCHWLENVYWISQIGLVIIAAVAACVAYNQLSASNKFELLKVLETQNVRQARQFLFRKLHGPHDPPENWWVHDDKLEEAASTICASFDIVALMAFKKNRQFFAKKWAHPICWTYRDLAPYIQARNPSGYQDYHKLYQEAEHYDSSASTIT